MATEKKGIIKLPPADCYNQLGKGYYGSRFVKEEMDAQRGTESYKKLRVKLLVAQNFLCAYCLTDLRGKKANIEHIIPVSKGGSNKQKNLVMACPECNKYKNDKLIPRARRKLIKTNISKGIGNSI